MKLIIAESDVKKTTNLNKFRLFSHQRRKKALIQLISKTVPAGSSILDVGCAAGDIAVELSLIGYKVHGIDLEPVRLNNARNLSDLYGQKILFECKPFEDIDSNDHYDIVLLGEVLEHFTDPITILEEVKYLLGQNGKVVITTPNMPSLRNKLAFGLLGIFPDNNPEHKYYFDFKRFTKVACGAGYDTLYLKSAFTSIQYFSKILSYFESYLLFWFTWLFPRSGDTIFAVISPHKILNQE